MTQLLNTASAFFAPVGRSSIARGEAERNPWDTIQ